MVQFDNTQANSEGWGIFDCDGSSNGPWQLQKCDELGIFEFDSDAWLFVYNKAQKLPSILTAMFQIVMINLPCKEDWTCYHE
jgi:hypothetical protein